MRKAVVSNLFGCERFDAYLGDDIVMCDHAMEEFAGGGKGSGDSLRTTFKFICDFEHGLNCELGHEGWDKVVFEDSSVLTREMIYG